MPFVKIGLGTKFRNSFRKIDSVRLVYFSTFIYVQFNLYNKKHNEPINGFTCEMQT